MFTSCLRNAMYFFLTANKFIEHNIKKGFTPNLSRAVTKALILIEGGGAYSYIRVLPDEFLLKSTVMTTDFKRNSSGRTRIYEYPPPPHPISALATALNLSGTLEHTAH